MNILDEIPEEKRDSINIVEALIFSSDGPLPVQKIKEIVITLTPKEISRAVDYLNELYRANNRCFEIRQIAGGYQMFTLPEYSSFINKLYQSRSSSRLTQKSLETLAIISYKQPVTKHEVEEIRGVNVDGVLRNLLSRNLITISGRAQAPGAPFLYRTTQKFLEYFGLNDLSDLPKLKELDELIDVEDKEHPYHEIFMKEIAPHELGLKEANNGINNAESNTGKEKENSS